MASQVGAAWARGGCPPWMEQPPWFDEAIAADRADDAALLAERFGTLDDIAAERDQPPRPRPAGRWHGPPPTDDDATRARRRATLVRALRDTDHPTAHHGHRAA